MPVVVLSGGNYETANSYTSDPQFSEEIHYQAVERLESEFRFYGHRLYETQALDFPRTKLYLNGLLQPAGTLYLQLGKAQAYYMEAIASGKFNELGEEETLDFSIGSLSMKLGDSASKGSSSSSQKPKDFLSNLLVGLGERVPAGFKGDTEK